MNNLEDIKIAIIGLGYVGLPLAVEFGKIYDTLGFDINKARIKELEKGFDRTNEVEPELLKEAEKLKFSNNIEDLKSSNIYIITVPTPIDKNKTPDLSPLRSASKMLSQVVGKDDIVIYESTVYPGATEEVCLPIIEEGSGLTFNKDFFAGYSPERINPGDKVHRVVNITKVTSGSTPEIADKVDALYASIITAGTYKASSIRVAEAAKVIENTQRDVNIGLINELSLIFNRLGIDTEEVLKAAGTKWNFLPFRPGLVGGHCIGVDPYYLTYKAQEIGYNPEMILAGRRINDSMGEYVVSQVIKLMLEKRIHINGAKILMMGLTFKENCPDLRNTRVTDMLEEFNKYGATVDVHDPWVDAEEAKQEYGISLVEQPKSSEYDAMILAVSHNQFVDMSAEQIRSYGKQEHVLYDIKYILNSDEVDGRL